MPRTLKFYGASDDLFECEGTTGNEPDEIGCYDKPAAVVIEAMGRVGLQVIASYDGAHENAVWAIGIAPLDEDIQLPDWPMEWKLGVRGYSTELTITVPDDAVVRLPKTA